MACHRAQSSPTLFTSYISDLPQTTSKQYGYADDLALLAADGTWQRVEMMLNQDMQPLHQYLERWRLKLSMVKTTTTAFHLNNKDIQHHLHVSVNSTALPNNDHPVYLGVMLDHTLTYRQHIESLKRKVNGRNDLLRCLAGSSWGACTAIACWCTVLPSTHHPCGATVLTSPSLIRASTTLCVLLPGVCVQRRLPSCPSLPASHHPTSTASHMPPILPKKPWRTQITYFTSEFLLLPQFPGSVSGHAGLSLDMLPASSAPSLTRTMHGTIMVHLPSGPLALHPARHCHPVLTYRKSCG